MTMYELYMSLSDKFSEVALRLLEQHNLDLAKFYLNVSEGYKRKAEGLLLNEAVREVM